MDHISTCSDRLAHPPLEVPFLANAAYTYDNMGMATYPQRVGINLSLFLQGCDPSLSIAGSANFLQSWLWFGIIHECLCLTRNKGPYSGPCHQPQSVILVKIIDKKNLVSLIDFQRSFLDVIQNNRPDTACNSNWIRLLDCLNFATNFTQKLLDNHPSLRSEGFTSDIFLVLLSTHILYQTIINMFNNAVKSNTALQHQVSRLHVPLELVNRLLESSGWQQKELDKLPRDVIFRYHLSFYFREILSLPVNLGRKYLTDERRAIQPIHTHVECHCNLIAVDGKALDNIVSEGKVPLLRFIQSSTAVRCLQLQSFNVSDNQSTSFVAISHVRSAGLGNESGNALQFCQISWLQSLVDSVNDGKQDTLFWIDTLCLPADREKKKEVLQQLWRIFKAATKVLVLDPPLYSRMAMMPDEAIVRIRYSSWKQKLWTLEEGFFSENLIFQFSNDAISLDALLDRLATEHNSNLNPGSWIIHKTNAILTPKQSSQLAGLLLAFADDIRLITRKDCWNLVARNKSYDYRGYLLLILRLGYLMADKFCYFVEEDERSTMSHLWPFLRDTYDSVEYFFVREAVDSPTQLTASVSRLQAMAQFPMDSWISQLVRMWQTLWTVSGLSKKHVDKLEHDRKD